MLVGNGTLLNTMLGRSIGGTLSSSFSAMSPPSRMTTGIMRARHFGAAFMATNGLPGGYAGRSIVLPIRSGSIACRFTGGGEGSLAASSGAGLPSGATLDGGGAISAGSAALTVSAAASITAVGAADAAAVGALRALAALASTGAIQSAASAEASAGAVLVASGTVSAGIAALGAIAASITPFTELSPEALASSVWSSLAADYRAAGTMGLLLGDAGGGSSPSTIADAVWTTPLAGRTIDGTFGGELTRHIYTAKVSLVVDDDAGIDRYTCSWFRDGVPVTTTTPTIAVIRASNGTSLVPPSSMTIISGGRSRLDVITRVTPGESCIAQCSAIIDGGTRLWDQLVGRDS